MQDVLVAVSDFHEFTEGARVDLSRCYGVSVSMSCRLRKEMMTSFRIHALVASAGARLS
jgi:hypothetical protein